MPQEPRHSRKQNSLSAGVGSWIGAVPLSIKTLLVRFELVQPPVQLHPAEPAVWGQHGWHCGVWGFAVFPDQPLQKEFSSGTHNTGCMRRELCSHLPPCIVKCERFVVRGWDYPAHLTLCKLFKTNISFHPFIKRNIGLHSCFTDDHT